MTELERLESQLIKRPEINNICTGCFYKYKQGLCPDEKREICNREKIIWQKAKKK